jgi:hypothetical protein
MSHKKEHNLVNNYIKIHYNKPFSELSGKEMLDDIITVFGANEFKSKHLIREYFKDRSIKDSWFKYKETIPFWA